VITKIFFNDHECAIVFLKQVLPIEIKRHLDFDTLEIFRHDLFSPDKNPLLPDICYIIKFKSSSRLINPARGKANYCIIQIEEQHTPVSSMILRLYNYKNAILSHIEAKHQAKHGNLNNFILPFYIPIVLHCGKAKWKNFCNLNDFAPCPDDPDWPIKEFLYTIFDELSGTDVSTTDISPDYDLLICLLQGPFSLGVDELCRIVCAKIDNIAVKRRKYFIDASYFYLYRSIKANDSDYNAKIACINDNFSKYYGKEEIKVFSDTIASVLQAKGVIEGSIDTLIDAIKIILERKFDDFCGDKNLYNKLDSIRNKEKLTTILKYAVDAKSIDDFIERSDTIQ
jgi:hypothetical protein